jgi:arylsulfatase A-like enzyme
MSNNEAAPIVRPDVVILMTDEERAMPAYEDPTVRQWRRQHLAAEQWFAEHAVTFERHYTGAVACVPSRPTLFTGQYPDVHGVTQTDGLGKMADDSRMRWLRPGEVPTLGHWFRAAGYDTYYDGKWHLSHADLTDPATGERLVTNTADGEVLNDAVATYLDADPLDVFGFSGWVGPEPHGGDPADAGIRRDPLVAARVVAWLEDRYQRRRAGDPEALRPFVCVASFVNPHDIVLFPAWTRQNPLEGHDPHDTPQVPAPPTASEDLSTKPSVHAAYRDCYPTGYGPAEIVNGIYTDQADQYRQLYLRLHAEVDGPLDSVRRAVVEASSDATCAPAGTVVVRTADHGELLGAHGGLHQKWFTLYDEAVRVPFALVHLTPDATGAAGANVGRGTDTGSVGEPSSHVDLIPTLLDAAGLDEAPLADRLRPAFTELHPLPGRSLWPLVTGQDPARTSQPQQRHRAVYLQTRDNILEGDQGLSAVARRLEIDDPGPELQIAVPGSVPTNVEAVVVRVDDDEAAGGAGHLWKLARTFDDPACWSEPGVRQLATSAMAGESWRTEVLSDEWELYDLDADPAEAHNLAGDPGSAGVQSHLTGRLSSERFRCLPARHHPWPYAARNPSLG